MNLMRLPLLLLLCLFLSFSSFASHFKGGNVHFQCQGNGYYTLVFDCYYACEPGSVSPYSYNSFTFDVSSSCGLPSSINCVSQTNPVDAPDYGLGVLTTCDYAPYSSAPAGTPSGTYLVTYSTNSFYVAPGCNVFASLSNGNRNGSIANLVNPSSYYIYENVSMTGGSNTRCGYALQYLYPVPSVIPLNRVSNMPYQVICANNTIDSVVYELVNPRGLNAGGGSLPFISGCDSLNPLGVPGQSGSFVSAFSLNRYTGVLTLTPSAVGNYVIAVNATAYRNGVVVAAVTADNQVTVVNAFNVFAPPILINTLASSNLSGGIVTGPTSVSVCPGSALQFDLQAVANDSNRHLDQSSNIASTLPGATIAVSHRGALYDTMTMHISWTPQLSDSGYRFLSLTLRDSVCSSVANAYYGFTFNVYKGMYASPKNQVYCSGGQLAEIHATGGTNYTWSDISGGSAVGIVSYNQDSSTIWVSVNSLTKFVVRSTAIGLCRNADTVTVGVTPLFTLSASAQDSVVCKYDNTTLAVAAAPSGQGPFSYSWSGGAMSPHSATTNSGALLAATNFYVDVTSADGCILHDTVHVGISGVSPRIAISSSTNNVCPGDSIDLQAIVLYEDIYPNGTVDTCVSNSIIGSYSSSNDTSNSTGVTYTAVSGSPFRGGYNSYKVQYLIHASELNAAGMSSATITDMSFFVKGLTSSIPYDTFSVSMGVTTADSLTSFVNSLSEVRSPQTFIPNYGWSVIPFNHFYTWDGVSNLVVQVCYTLDPNAVSNDDFVAYTNTSFGTSVLWKADFSGNGCNLSSAALLGCSETNRPIVRFGTCTAASAVTYRWTPRTLGVDSNLHTVVAITAPATYTFSARSPAGCNGQGSIQLSTSPNLATQLARQMNICAGDTVALNLGFTNPLTPSCIRNYNVVPISYTPISGSQTIIPTTSYTNALGFANADDGTAGPYTLPFSFPFYCESFSQFWVNSNGWISFENPYPLTSAYQERAAQAFPTVLAANLNPQKIITLMMGDYRVSSSSSIGYFTVGTSQSRTFVIQFNNLNSFSGGYQTNGQFQLHEQDGSIDILLGSSNFSGANHTTGINDSTGLGIAAPGRNNTAYLINTPEAWHFAPVAPSDFIQAPVHWSPNVFLSSDTAVSPRAYPSSSQTYYVDANVLINPQTVPSVCHVRDSVRVIADHFVYTLESGRAQVCTGDTTRLLFHTANTVSSIAWSPSTGLSNPYGLITIDTISGSHTYRVTAVDAAGCQVHDAITITASGNCVWPGDADDNHLADNTDILYIGMAFGDTGTVRPAASLVWTAQGASAWDSSFGGGVNCVHADCDGNGSVGYNDTTAVHLNFGLTHSKNNAQRQGAIPIYITSDKGLYGSNDTMKLTLSIGDNSVSIQKIYGIAYDFDFATSSSCRLISIHQDNSWMGEKLGFMKLNGTAAYMAQSRVDHRDTSGYGMIAEVQVVSDIVASYTDSVHFSVDHILALTSRGDTVLLAPATHTVAVSQHPLGLAETDEDAFINLYPNPNNGSFRVVQPSAIKTKMTITDELGRIVYEMNLSEKMSTVDLVKVPAGIYTATFTSALSHMSKRLVVKR